jgi:8-oxo-dGTP pyrophosphatase MutT (NUDIX family)
MEGLVEAIARIGWRTADGTPISRGPPYGVTVVVSRDGVAERDFLLLHRAALGADFDGDWAWGPPAGARLPGEAVEECARRELLEETGLALDPVPGPCGTGEWAVFAASVPADAEIRLSAEHDRHVWLPLDDAVGLCLPAAVGEQLRAAAER